MYIDFAPTSTQPQSWLAGYTLGIFASNGFFGPTCSEWRSVSEVQTLAFVYILGPCCTSLCWASSLCSCNGTFTLRSSWDKRVRARANSDTVCFYEPAAHRRTRSNLLRLPHMKSIKMSRKILNFISLKSLPLQRQQQ